LPALLAVPQPWGWLGALWVFVNLIWGSAVLLHLFGVISWCPLHSFPIPCRHEEVLDKWLLMEKLRIEQSIKLTTSPTLPLTPQNHLMPATCLIPSSCPSTGCGSLVLAAFFWQ